METLLDYTAERDTAIATVERNAGPDFRERATAHVLTFLKSNGPATGEELTDACKRQGIVAHDDRAMGPVLMSLSRRKLIEKCGHAVRTKGHLTSGGNIWQRTQNHNTP